MDLHNVPAPNSTKEFQAMARIWASFTGLSDDDPYVVATAHTYGLYDRILHAVASGPAPSTSSDLAEQLALIVDRLDQIENKLGGSGTNIPHDLDSPISKMLRHQLLIFSALRAILKQSEDIVAKLPSSPPAEIQALKTALEPYGSKSKKAAVSPPWRYWLVPAILVLSVCTTGFTAANFFTLNSINKQMVQKK